MKEGKLLSLLKGVPENTIWGFAIKSALESTEGNLGELVLELQAQYFDNPTAVRYILGSELCDYIMKPFAPTMKTFGEYAIKKIQEKPAIDTRPYPQKQRKPYTRKQIHP